ncbi:MAG: type II secretion system protein N [Casimicrobiaceae bacterium]
MTEAQLYVAQPAPTGTLPVRWKLAAAVAMLIALALLALVGAYWGWRWFGPVSPTLAASAPDRDYARRIGDARLFGAAASTTSASPVTATAGAGDLRLLGVIAQRDGKGYALLRGGARGPLLITTGEEVAAGVRLESVRPDGITLLDGGVRRDMALRAAASADKPARTVVAPAAKSAACSAPAGFTGPIVRLNAELLGGMMNTSDAWKALVEPGAGALVVRDQSGFAGNLGLKNGDLIASANGVPLAIPADIPSLVLQPLTRSQQVWLAGHRNGKPQQWLYLNAGACPG